MRARADPGVACLGFLKAFEAFVLVAWGFLGLPWPFSGKMEGCKTINFKKKAHFSLRVRADPGVPLL